MAHIYDLLGNFFANYEIDEETMKKYIAEFLTVVIIKIIQLTQPKLTSHEKSTLERLFKEKKFEQVMPLIESKYTPQEFEEMLDTYIKPLFDSYKKEVLDEI